MMDLKTMERALNKPVAFTVKGPKSISKQARIASNKPLVTPF